MMRKLRIADRGMMKSLSLSKGWICPDACLRFFCSVLSGVLLFASFPPLEWALLGWAALVPLLVICASSSPGESFKWGFLCGLVFWLMSISWVTRVSCAGWIALCAYCALYVACFSMTASWWIQRRGVRSGTGNPLLLMLIPALWVGFEFSRSTVGTGFPWNALGVSLFDNLALIQCAEWGGVYLVSYMIVLANTAVALTVVQYWRVRGPLRYRPHPELIICLTVVALSFWYGSGAVRRFQSRSGTIIVAAVQPNIPQVEKWSEEWFTEIYDRLRSVTEKAVAASDPDLVVWPETAVPEFVRYSGPTRVLVDDLMTNGVPLLVGSMDYKATDSSTNFYNSSFLFMPNETPLQFYDKRHLVLFGEYIPMEGIIPFVRSLTPIEGSFSAGTTSTVFRLGRSGHAFAVLICFEDTVAWLARECVRNGARLLINQTNDAWFDPSSASRQQMAHCVFRCVENRVAAVRATNTGVTCFIDRNGVVYAALDRARGHSSAPEYGAKPVFIPGADMPLTFYTRYGDVFAFICVALMIPLFGAAALSVFRRRSKNKSLRIDE